MWDEDCSEPTMATTHKQRDVAGCLRVATPQQIIKKVSTAKLRSTWQLTSKKWAAMLPLVPESLKRLVKTRSDCLLTSENWWISLGILAWDMMMVGSAVDASLVGTHMP